MRRFMRSFGAASAMLFSLAGCELAEITIVDAEDVVVAEVYVQLTGPGGVNGVYAFLHRTLDATGTSHPVPGARVIVSRNDGFSLELAEAPLEACAATLPVDATGTCHRAATELAQRLRPGDALQLQVLLPGGGVLEASSTAPGAFETVVPQQAGEVCRMDPDTALDLRWTRSEGAWAYASETLLRGLPAALAPEGIVVEDDPLYLLGLSVSAADTSIVFPGEFGVFNRFELDQALALRLQVGLPAGTSGDVAVTAADRNYVNWVRGGNFNPSGQVRVPSVRGDGTGVFAVTLTQRFGVEVGAVDMDAPMPSCSGP